VRTQSAQKVRPIMEAYYRRLGGLLAPLSAGGADHGSRLEGGGEKVLVAEIEKTRRFLARRAPSR
jgi:hypothetical protein